MYNIIYILRKYYICIICITYLLYIYIYIHIYIYIYITNIHYIYNIYHFCFQQALEVS